MTSQYDKLLQKGPSQTVSDHFWFITNMYFDAYNINFCGQIFFIFVLHFLFDLLSIFFMYMHHCCILEMDII